MTGTTPEARNDLAPGVPVLHLAMADLGPAARSVWLDDEATLIVQADMPPAQVATEVAHVLGALQDG